MSGQRALLVALVLAAPSCALLVDVSNLPGNGALSHEAGADAVGDVVAPLEAGTDGPVSPLDAASGDAGDADAGGDASDAGFCATKGPGLFCADFDEGGVGAGWTSVHFASPTSSIALDGTSFVSGPQSARFDLVGNAPACTDVELWQTDFTTQVTTLHFETKIYFDANDSGQYPNYVFGVGHGTGDADCSLIVYVDTGSTWLLEQDFYGDGGVTSTNSSSGLGAPAHTWTKVAIDADYSIGKATVTVDGTTTLQANLTTACLGPGVPGLKLGFHCTTPRPSPISARFDDVLLK